MNVGKNFATLHIYCHDYLAHGTIWVSPDIWAIIKKRYGEEGRDAAFLRALGIAPGSSGEPDKGVNAVIDEGKPRW